MTAPAITRTRAEVLVIARAQAALAAVRSDLFPWPSQGGFMISDYADWLAEGLGIYTRLLKDPGDPECAHPADVFPELADGWPDDAVGQALERVIRDIADDTGALVTVIREQCGSEGAEFVQAAVDRAEAGQ